MLFFSLGIAKVILSGRVSQTKAAACCSLLAACGGFAGGGGACQPGSFFFLSLAPYGTETDDTSTITHEIYQGAQFLKIASYQFVRFTECKISRSVGLVTSSLVWPPSSKTVRVYNT
jgi:hypothetical protein